MRKFFAVLTIAAAALPALLAPAAAEKLGRVGTPTYMESAAAADGEKTFFKIFSLECIGNNCIGAFKGKAGRLTTITEVECIMESAGQIQAGQVYIDNMIIGWLPVASRATNGVNETVVIKTPTDYVLDGGKTMIIGLYSYGVGSFGSCLVKGMSTPL